MTKSKIIAITGVSAGGKTALAIELAKELNGEIISVDSRQIYKELDIGSAKPEESERQGIKHHMIDVVDVTQEYSAANFCDDAKKTIKDIQKRGKNLILAGGTGLYFRILLQDLELPRVEPDKFLREELQKKSSEELYKQLEVMDFEIAKKIHPNNKVKIIRAIEVCTKLKVPMSKAQKRKEEEFDTLWFGLNSGDREFIYERINKRVDRMFQKGLIEEAKRLFNKYKENKILMNTIGYKEILPYLNGDIDFNTSANLLKQNTRRYAKRQISWFKANKNINWFDIKKQTLEEIKEEALFQIYKFYGKRN